MTSEIGHEGEVVGARIISRVLEDDHAFAEAVVSDTGGGMAQDASRLGEPRYTMGNASGPTGARPGDFGLPKDAPPDTPVGPYGPAPPQQELPGMSVFKSPEDAQAAGLGGKVYEIPPGELPPGVGIQDNGVDVGGTAPYGHSTIYPSQPTTFGDFQDLTKSLPGSEPVANINKRGILSYSDGSGETSVSGDTRHLTDGSTLSPGPGGAQVRTFPDGRKVLIPAPGGGGQQVLPPDG